MGTSPEQRSIWHWPVRVGPVFAVLAALRAMFLIPDLPGLEPSEAFNLRLQAIVWEAMWAFVVGFFATVSLLTYVRVTELRGV